MSNSFTEFPIVMLSMSRWDGDFSSASWSLAQTFSEDQVVYYVDYPFTIIDVIREWSTPTVKKRRQSLIRGRSKCHHIPGQHKNLKFITPAPMLPINWLPPDSMLYRWLSRFNNLILFRAIKKALKNDGHAACILFNSFNPLYGYYKPKNLDIRLFIYQSRDNINALEYYLKKHGSQLEIEAIRAADISYATSKQLQKDLTDRSGKQVEFLPNAADIPLFETARTETLPSPDDISHVKGPIIGYTGNICQRLDYDLIKYVISAHPDKSYVFVGPKNFYQHTDIDLDSIPNLYFTGAKNIKALPAYLRRFDVLLLPFKCNELTSRIYPLKINEYLASGKPVISTNFSRDIQSFEEVVYIALDKEAFSKAVQNALDEDREDMRIHRHQVSTENSWKKRVEMIRKQCKSLLSK